MQKQVFFLVSFIFISLMSFAQVGIGTTAPNSSAKLDIVSTTQGVLFPRMTAAERAAIVNPALGLFVFQTNGTTGLYYFDGGSWRNITTGLVPSAAGDATPSGTISSVFTIASFPFNGAAIATDAAGNIYISNSNGSVQKYSPSGAGGFLFSCSNPQGIAVTGDVLYAVESGTNSIIKFNLTTFTKTILAGNGTSGTTDGTGSSARFNSPAGIAVGPGGNLYVTEILSGKIRKITPAGVVTTLAVTLSHPGEIAINAAGEIFIVADKMSFGLPFGREIVKIGADEITQTPVPTLTQPGSICFDTDGTLYAISNISIIKITPGMFLTTTLAGGASAGSADGSGSAATFNQPVAIANSGNFLYVIDQNINGMKVRRFVIR